MARWCLDTWDYFTGVLFGVSLGVSIEVLLHGGMPIDYILWVVFISLGWALQITKLYKYRRRWKQNE